MMRKEKDLQRAFCVSPGYLHDFNLILILIALKGRNIQNPFYRYGK